MMLELISKLVPLKEKIRIFEQQYNTPLDGFSEKIKTADEEFSSWDDYIEWKAYAESVRELEEQLESMRQI